MGDVQALDDQKCGAEDGGQAPTLDDQNFRSTAPKMGNQQAPTSDDQTHGAEDVGSAVADARRPEALRRR